MPPSERTIAIVEDDASFRCAIERLLRASEFEAQTFTSAEEFLSSAAPELHACLILDIHLPTLRQGAILPAVCKAHWRSFPFRPTIDGTFDCPYVALFAKSKVA
jgi:FixJ family two-component response regulator